MGYLLNIHYASSYFLSNFQLQYGSVPHQIFPSNFHTHTQQNIDPSRSRQSLAAVLNNSKVRSAEISRRFLFLNTISSLIEYEVLIAPRLNFYCQWSSKSSYFDAQTFKFSRGQNKNGKLLNIARRFFAGLRGSSLIRFPPIVSLR